MESCLELPMEPAMEPAIEAAAETVLGPVPEASMAAHLPHEYSGPAPNWSAPWSLPSAWSPMPVMPGYLPVGAGMEESSPMYSQSSCDPPTPDIQHLPLEARVPAYDDSGSSPYDSAYAVPAITSSMLGEDPIPYASDFYSPIHGLGVDFTDASTSPVGDRARFYIWDFAIKYLQCH